MALALPKPEEQPVIRTVVFVFIYVSRWSHTLAGLVGLAIIWNVIYVLDRPKWMP
jgi:hypothetical protein